MKDERLISYLKNDLPGNEMIEVKNWINALPENEKYFNRIKFVWENTSFDDQNIEISSGEAWERIHSSINGERTDHSSNIRLGIAAFMRIAAILIILISIGVLITWIIRQNQDAEIEWISVNTTSSTNDFLLPDGSHVWLNNHSEINYPVKFTGNSREMNLKGEAFFDVKNNKKKPFIIHAATSEIRVLGTSFNVKTGRTTPEVIVTVVSGSVSLCDSSNTENKVILEPGDQGLNFPDAGGLAKKENDDANFMAWKTGILIFENMSLENVCKALSAYYNRPFMLDNEEILKDKTLTATFDHKNIAEIQKILEITLDISCETDKDTITLSAN